MIYSSFWSDGQKSSWTSRPVDERPPKDPKKTPLPRPGNSTSTPQISWWSTQQKRQARTVCGTEGKKHELRPFPNVLEPADKNPKEISKWQSTEMVGQGALRRNLTQSSKMPRESKPWIFMTTRVQMSSSDNIMDPGWLQIVKVGKGFPCCLSCRTAGQKPLETMSTGMFWLGIDETDLAPSGIPSLFTFSLLIFPTGTPRNIARMRRLGPSLSILPQWFPLPTVDNGIVRSQFQDPKNGGLNYIFLLFVLATGTRKQKNPGPRQHVPM